MAYETPKRHVSRRDLGRLAAGAAAGTLLAGAAGAPAEARPEPPLDPRLAAIEKSRGKPLSAEQRKAVLDNIHESEQGWEKGRAFPVPDGTPPDFVFRPRKAE